MPDLCEPIAVALPEQKQATPNARHTQPSCGRAHLVGAGGAGMQALAHVLEGAGWHVTGSDADPQSLVQNTTNFYRGHSAGHLLAQPDVVVRSPAVPEDNVEVTAAARLGIPVVTYPQMLGRLIASKFGIAVAGTHGKSTTAAMLASILTTADCDPTVVVGAQPLAGASLNRYGHGPHMVVEACEYQSSFLQLRPQAAAILGIEPDHFDYYRNQQQLEDEFARFIRLLPADGTLVVNQKCAATARILNGRRAIRFGFTIDCDWSARPLVAHQGRYRFELCHRAQPVAEIALQVPGLHNVENALAAAALAHHAGASAAQIRRGLEAFRGLKRRLQLLGSAAGVTFIDDYAHHPTQIHAVLQTVRQMYPAAHICCIFEPHQASRTKSLLDELAGSLQNADTLAIAEIYRAREPAWSPGEITSADLAEKLSQHGARVAPVHDYRQIHNWLIERWQTRSLAHGDIVLTLGAGRIGNLAHGVYDWIRKNSKIG